MHQALHITLNSHSLLRMLLLSVAGFVVSMLLTPLYTYSAYRWQLWKRPRATTLTGQPATVFNKLHAAKQEKGLNSENAARILSCAATWGAGQASC